MRVLTAAFVALAGLAVSPAHACLQEEKMEAKGPPVPADAPLPAVVVLPREHWEQKLRDNADKCRLEGAVEACNSQAVALVRLGRAAEAIPLLEAVEKKTPGVYQTAVNLGTALELTGQDEAALKWINEGMRRNPQSHAGTEWLHAQILETKLALKKDPQWLRARSPVDGAEHGMTGLQAEPAWRASGVTLASGRALSQDDVSRALWYQLNERLQFVKPPEAIVGELLLELASLVAIQEKTGDKAMRLLKQAEEFQPVRMELLAARKKHFEGLLAADPRARRPEVARAESGPSYGYLAAFFAILIAWAVWRRVARRRQG